MHPIFEVLFIVIDLYTWVLILAVISSWLIAFSVINRSNQLVHMITDLLFRITESALAPIRRRLPHLGGIDISPFVLILGLYFLKRLIVYYA